MMCNNQVDAQTDRFLDNLIGHVQSYEYFAYFFTQCSQLQADSILGFSILLGSPFLHHLDESLSFDIHRSTSSISTICLYTAASRCLEATVPECDRLFLIFFLFSSSLLHISSKASEPSSNRYGPNSN